MKLPRPYVPLKVRILVARRQVLQLPDNPFSQSMKSIIAAVPIENINYTKYTLQLLLASLGMLHDAQLDHDPPLMLRQKLYHNGTHVAYSPPANDPEFLIYRNASDHKIKTLIRGNGAQRSDFAQRRYLKRLEKNRRPTKKKFKPRPAKQIRRIK